MQLENSDKKIPDIFSHFNDHRKEMIRQKRKKNFVMPVSSFLVPKIVQFFQNKRGERSNSYLVAKKDIFGHYQRIYYRRRLKTLPKKWMNFLLYDRFTSQSNKDKNFEKRS